MFRRFFPIILALTLLFSMAVPAFGASADESQITPRASYRTGTVRLNGVDYDYTASVGTNSTYGAYSYVTVDKANISRRHNNIKVTFLTSDSGNQPATGGYKDTTCTGASRSYYVAYSGGMDKVVRTVAITGTILLFGTTTRTIELSL